MSHVTGLKIKKRKKANWASLLSLHSQLSPWQQYLLLRIHDDVYLTGMKGLKNSLQKRTNYGWYKNWLRIKERILLTAVSDHFLCFLLWTMTSQDVFGCLFPSLDTTTNDSKGQTKESQLMMVKGGGKSGWRIWWQKWSSPSLIWWWFQRRSNRQAINGRKIEASVSPAYESYDEEKKDEDDVDQRRGALRALLCSKRVSCTESCSAGVSCFPGCFVHASSRWSPSFIVLCQLTTSCCRWSSKF